ncbi:hypothetical protein [Paracnuella aquatica]|uniref:hypothetical protein n=1 Tax=Paracnuella aquatica TaxID=2268757 RepID=UPI000DEED3C5|nr:hypothetical protein [Paracnuella aquatica]RPD46639.1 hypothetical protein DRJ53_12930 [Paracnuella aquatica]
MDTKKFLQSVQENHPPTGISTCLQALWFDAKEDWEEAHRLIQDEPGSMPGRIHAYLHRKEGDSANAGYWYRRAGVSPFTGSLQEEWRHLVDACLNGA